MTVKKVHMRMADLHKKLMGVSIWVRREIPAPVPELQQSKRI